MSTETPQDLSQVTSEGLIVVYDNLLSTPRIIKVSPGKTLDFIESLATQTYELSHGLGGSIPYTIIREVTENFIHASFHEVVISILDSGNTLRFSDQGPGIMKKDKAREPGFTSATQAMRPYIRGVGSGLPIVDEYLGITNGTLLIEDNLEQGAVITISLKPHNQETPLSMSSFGRAAVQETTQSSSVLPKLSDRALKILEMLDHEGPQGVSAIAQYCSIPLSSTHALLKKMEEDGVIHTEENQKRRSITPLGKSLIS